MGFHRFSAMKPARVCLFEPWIKKSEMARRKKKNNRKTQRLRMRRRKWPLSLLLKVRKKRQSWM